MNGRFGRPTPAVVLAALALFVALGGAAYAGSKIATKDIKSGAVTGKKIRHGAVGTAKLKDGAVGVAKLKDGAVTGPKLADGSVSSSKFAGDAEAPAATVAGRLEGQTSFYFRGAIGAEETLATSGPISLVGQCLSVGTETTVRIIARTTEDGAAMNGQDNLDGSTPANSLNTTTPADDSELVSMTIPSANTRVSRDRDEGFAQSLAGNTLTANSDGIALGINYGGDVCRAVGVINSISPPA